MIDQAMALFRVKLEASIRRFEMLYADGNHQEIIELIKKMVKEAHNVGIVTLDNYEIKMQILLKQREERMEEFYTQFDYEFQKFFDAVQALRENKKEEKKAIIETLNAQEGIAKFNGDIKEYRNQLIKFSDSYADIMKSIRNYNDAELLRFAQKIQNDSNLIGAKKIYEVATKLEDIYNKNKKEKDSYLESYRRAFDENNDVIEREITPIQLI